MSFNSIIVMWHGEEAYIPDNWKLCNGLNNTPDLRNLFIIGAGDTYAPGAAGGAATHTHAFDTSFHTHGSMMPPPTPITAGNYRMTEEMDSGTTAAENNLAPYYALCFIMHTGFI
jgi:hypothetical protein